MYYGLLIQGLLALVNEVIFDSIDKTETLRVSLRSKGAARVSGLDAEEWKKNTKK